MLPQLYRLYVPSTLSTAACINHIGGLLLSYLPQSLTSISESRDELAVMPIMKKINIPVLSKPTLLILTYFRQWAFSCQCE